MYTQRRCSGSVYSEEVFRQYTLRVGVQSKYIQRRCLSKVHSEEVFQARYTKSLCSGKVH